MTARVLQFAGKLMKSPSPLSTTMPALLHRVESPWVEAAQNTLKKDPRYGMWKGQLGFFTDKEGLLHCRGRLQNADFPFSTQFPLILPRDSHFTVLLVRQAHVQVFHNWVKDTLTQI